jgi:OFA family oxalate/formate antiporter-like MFS transporter
LLQTWSLLVSTAGVMVIGHVVPLAVELGIAQAAAVLAMGALSLANGLGRPIYGSLTDRLGHATTMFAGALLMGLAILSTIPLTHGWGTAGLVGAMLFVGSSYGSMVPLNTATVMHLFGTEHYGTNLGLSTFQIALSGILGPQLAAILRESTGTYNLALAITGLLALGACAVALLFGLTLRRAAGLAAGRS